jgi:endonuclease-3 related protein
MEKNRLTQIFEILHSTFGPQGWWPGETELEVIIGAVLTQNTAWPNVEKAIENLKNEDLLDLDKLVDVETGRLAELIRPSGYYNLKALRLKKIIKFVYESGGVESLSSQEAQKLRELLLGVNGIGKETADSILLYAFEKPFFVVDTYTKRLFSRLGMLDEASSYDEVQNLFIANLDSDVGLFNEYHALIVKLGKEFCKRKSPLCRSCPLRMQCIFSR